MNPDVVSAARSALPASDVYADWAARALPLPRSGSPLLRQFRGHPHSTGYFASERGNSVPHASARLAISKFLNVEPHDHDVVLTSGTTAALQTVAQRLPWRPGDVFVCHASAHSALLGIRAVAVSAGASFVALDTNGVEEALFGAPCSTSSDTDVGSDELDRPPFVLFGFPGECNLTGARYPVERWCEAAHRSQWARKYLSSTCCARDVLVVTLVDAAALVASTPLSRGALNHVDLLSMSIYKIIGSPTGVGALLVRRDSAAAKLLLSTAFSSYFAGGRSVSAASPYASRAFVPSLSVIDSLEVGTPNLDALLMFPQELARVDSELGGMTIVAKRAEAVASLFRLKLVELLPYGRSVIHEDKQLTGSDASQGPIVSFSIFSSTGEPVSHTDVATVLGMQNIHVRAGGMCNPGATMAAVGLRPEEGTVDVLAGRRRRCAAGIDSVRGLHTGVVRASFGWASIETDAIRIADVLGAHWGCGVRDELSCVKAPPKGGTPVLEVDSIALFPVKGIGGSEVSVVATGEHGLIGDRIAAVKAIGSRELLNRASAPFLSRILARVQGKSLLFTQSDCISRPDCNTFALFLEETATLVEEGPVPEKDSFFRWLSASSGGKVAGELVFSKQETSFANRGGSVHIVLRESCEAVAKELGEGWNFRRVASAARANIVLSSGSNLGAWEEDSWAVESGRIRIGESVVVEGLEGCKRCSAFNVERGEPLRTLVKLRREAGCPRLFQFGLIGRVSCDGLIRLGDKCVLEGPEEETHFVCSDTSFE